MGEKKYPKRTDHWYLMDVFNKSWIHTSHIYGIIRRMVYLVPRKPLDQKLIWGGGTGFH